MWCLYCTKLEPIFKTNDVARAKRIPHFGFQKTDEFPNGALGRVIFLNFISPSLNKIKNADSRHSLVRA
jgi:hypothetical protein